MTLVVTLGTLVISVAITLLTSVHIYNDLKIGLYM